MTNKEIFIETAYRIGERIVKNAIWDGDKCTWEIKTSGMGRSKGGVPITEKAGGTIYQGTAGIALFLCELFKKTGNKVFIDTAESAMKFSLTEISNLKANNFGFLCGKTGIAYSLAILGRYSEKEKYINQSDEILKTLIGKEETDSLLDVIGGGAGAIPVLLFDIFVKKSGLQLAINLGEHIINTAHKEPVGWSMFGGNSNYRNLCGLAHGASGFAHAFIELYNVTSLSKYLYAAEQFFLYERQFLDKVAKNWPDFRYKEISSDLYYGELELLKQKLKQEKLPGYELNYMYAWCHGSPGIGLVRLRAFEITKHIVYKQEAEIAIEGIKNSMVAKNNFLSNYSLCHGLSGNCEILLYGAKVLKDKKLLNTAEEIAVLGWDKFEKQCKSWPCGTIGLNSDPSLMLGESGIGYYFLRLYDHDTPSVLLPRSKLKAGPMNNLDDSYLSLQEKYINSYFEKTLAALNKVPAAFKLISQNFILNIGNESSDIASFYKVIDSFINENKFEDAEIIRDIFYVEKEKYLLTLKIINYTEEFLDDLRKEEIEDLDFEESYIKLLPFTRVVVCKFDSSRWLNDKKNGNLLSDYLYENYILLFRNKNKIDQKKISPLTNIMLNQLKTPITINDLDNNVFQLIEKKNKSEKTRLKDIIYKQIVESYNANLVKVYRKIPPTAPRREGK